MISKLESALFGAVLFGCLANSVVLATPALAEPPRLSTATRDRIRALCEASSADRAGKRDERRCRTEWQERLERLGAEQGRPVRLLLR